ncbi:MAG: diaminopimelate decarboxylase [archaeon]
MKHGFENFDLQTILHASDVVDTPFYLYNQTTIDQKCHELKAMPNAYGLNVRFAMKANSTKGILRTICLDNGLCIDASSLNEVQRAHMAGIPYGKIMLTTQEVPLDKDRIYLEYTMTNGLKYNVCSMLQLNLISDFASKNKIPLSMRVHPGVGSGESATRNTGDKYSCFGIHLTDLEKSLSYAKEKSLIFNKVHVHIGSGGSPEKWRENIDRELGFIEKYFLSKAFFQPISCVSFGGGLKEARMPGENSADIQDLGNYATERINDFAKKTGRKLKMEIEPGTYVVADSGLLVTKVIDKKQTGEDGYNFIILNGGMEVNTRPLLYGSQHPFYVISKSGKLLSTESDLSQFDKEKDEKIVVGRCCESGDSQSLDETGHIVPRVMADSEVGDFVVVGGCGAYCSTMSPFNYNSHTQIPEVMLCRDKELRIIRMPQTLDQIIQNEL